MLVLKVLCYRANSQDHRFICVVKKFINAGGATGNHGKRKRKRKRERERKTGKGRQVETLSWTVATTAVLASVSQIHADSNSSMKPLCLMLEDSYTCKTVPLSE